MPKQSVKNNMIDSIAKLAMHKINSIEETMGMYGDREIDEILDEFYEDVVAIECSQPRDLFNIPKSSGSEARRFLLPKHKLTDDMERLQLERQHMEWEENIAKQHLPFEPLNQIRQLREQQLKEDMERLKLEKDQMQWKKNIEKRRLQLEEQKINNEFELRKRELDQTHELKKYKLKLKYGKK